MPFQIEAVRQTVVKIPVRVGTKGHRVQEVLKLLHLLFSQHFISTLKSCERSIELFQTITVSAPMEWFMTDDVLQGLGGHRAFHRMKIFEILKQQEEIAPKVVVLKVDTLSSP